MTCKIGDVIIIEKEESAPCEEECRTAHLECHILWGEGDTFMNYVSTLCTLELAKRDGKKQLVLNEELAL